MTNQPIPNPIRKPIRLSFEHSRWLADTFARNRATFAGFSMEAAGEGGDGGSGAGVGDGDGGQGGDQGQTLTQADVDAAVEKIAAKIRAEERRKVTEKFADYDDLRAKAEGAKTLEDRIADLESKGAQSELRAVRAEIASEFGISTKRGKATQQHPDGEPSDADLFLTATTADAIRQQAERLAGRDSARKKNGNHSPREGQHTTNNVGDGEMREFARGLFARANAD
ncbi:hypothetical protein KVF89_22410 [Nocardioides carbamazepini]|uniref:hypothetical protein n=1 Tax=Nocardioides carbamazepini TaxID=2854259 RepID=UPI00214A83DC|nr:hypothetical protein [Nocardioides carbamazepini]MCR1785310.1 hypothetical protein [Nocardioides carbamazepini]